MVLSTTSACNVTIISAARAALEFDAPIRASKRNFARGNKTAWGPRGQAETSLKIEDLRANKTTCNETMTFLVTL